jgi:hypothetical protein
MPPRRARDAKGREQRTPKSRNRHARRARALNEENAIARQA